MIEPASVHFNVHQSPFLNVERKERHTEDPGTARIYSGRLVQTQTYCMHEVGAIFAELGISQYLNDFLDQGFDTWETILDITESDFDVLKVKLGHRRKLQRRIAETRRLSSAEDATASPKHHTPNEDRLSEEHRILASREDGKDKDKDKDNASTGGAHGGKRKYRRHPKPDEHAPERPPSAYVLFSNKMRDDLKGRHLSFTEIAKLVGENWQNLPPSEKEPYEAQAFADKERYNQELAEYKKTEHYRNYNQYLADFKAKQASQQSMRSGSSNRARDLDVDSPIGASEGTKRPKLEKSRSSGSGSNSEGTSQQGGGSSGDYGGARSRMDSVSSTSTVMNGNPWGSAVHASPLGQLSQMPKLRINHSNSGSEHNKGGHSSPPTTSPHPNPNVSLPGYRESMHAQTLPWRELPREHEVPASASRLPPTSSSRRTYSTEAPSYPLQSPHSMGQSPSVPPLLSHESTASVNSRSSLSSASTNSSSMYFQPRTPIGPLEPQIDRPQMSLPSIFPSKPGYYEGNQLPPLRPASLSPNNSIDANYQTPLVPNVDYAIPPTHALRNYQRPSPPDSTSGASSGPTSNPPSQQDHKQDPPLSNFQQGFQAGSAHALQHPLGTSDGRGFTLEKELDPMSALVRAGEIISGNTSRGHQQ